MHELFRYKCVGSGDESEHAKLPPQVPSGFRLRGCIRRSLFEKKSPRKSFDSESEHGTETDFVIFNIVFYRGSPILSFNPALPLALFPLATL